MQRLDTLPSAFKRFRNIGGAVEFGVFAEAGGSDDDIVEAVDQLLRPTGSFDEVALRSSGGRPILKTTFLEDWYDPAGQCLLRRGSWQSDAGVTLTDPQLKTLDRVKIVGGATSIPQPGSGGQFAYAFSNPPYSLDAKPSKIQELFDAVCDFIMPPQARHDIRDWSSPKLIDVSDAFRAGMEWWGVFLFSIHVPALQRLTIAVASTTD